MGLKSSNKQKDVQSQFSCFYRIKSLQDAEPNTASLSNLLAEYNGREKFCNNIYLKGLDRHQ